MLQFLSTGLSFLQKYVPITLFLLYDNLQTVIKDQVHVPLKDKIYIIKDAK